jgi:hypothetical protein
MTIDSIMIDLTVNWDDEKRVIHVIRKDLLYARQYNWPILIRGDIVYYVIPGRILKFVQEHYK